MAEDFWSAFGIGYGAHTIADLDARGVALAAIQGLNAKLEAKLVERDATIAAQARDLEAQRAELAELRAKSTADTAELRRAVDVLLARMSIDSQVASSR